MNFKKFFNYLLGKYDPLEDPDIRKDIEGRLKALNNGLEDGYYEVRSDGQFVFFNNFFSRLTGYRPQDLKGRTLFNLLTGDCRQQVMETFQRIDKTGLPLNSVEMIIRRRDGERRVLEASASVRELMTEYGGTVIYGLVRDVTSQKENEDALQIGNSAMTVTNTPMIIIDPANINAIKYCNPAFEKMTGYTRKEVVGKYYTMLYGPETDIKAAESIRLALEHERECQVIIKCYRKDENSYWNDIIFSPVRDIKGRLKYFIGSMTDLTEKIDSVYEMRQNEERFRLLIENSSDGVSVVTDDGIILYESSAMKRILGLRNEKQRVENNLFDFIHPGDREKALTLFHDFVKRTGEIQQFTFRVQHADGSWRVMESVGHNLLNNLNINGIILNSRDITDRIAAENALRHSQERFQLFFDEDLTGDYILSLEGEILACNTAFARIVGEPSVSDVINTNIKSLYPAENIHGQIVDMIRKNKMIEGYELELKRLDGSTINVIQNISGRFNTQGKLVEIKGYMFDITERKKLEQHILNADKLHSLGTLAAGVAHDFNNILSILDGSLSMIKSHLKDKPASKYVSMGEYAVRRGADVASRLLTFARSEDAKMSPFKLRDVINDLTNVLKHTIDKKLIIQTSLDKGVPCINGDRGQIYQIMLNLCINARDAILDPKRVAGDQGRINIKAVEVYGHKVREKFKNADGDRYVCISVEDNGIGMSDSTRAQIFDPFFTTKENGKGTGLGLSVVYGIVEKHGGFIDVQSHEGEGTSVSVYLPAYHGKEPVGEETAETVPAGGSETILVVEDEEMMMTILSEILRTNGYSVLEARDGLEGYQMYQDNKDKIDAVVMDVGLPKMTGHELHQKLRELNPSVPIIIASGFSEFDFKNAQLNNGVRAYIKKPYKPNDILTILRKVFDTPA